MPKQTDIQRAIAKLEDDRRVIDMAIARLKEQQAAKPARVRKEPAVVADIVEARR